MANRFAGMFDQKEPQNANRFAGMFPTPRGIPQPRKVESAVMDTIAPTPVDVTAPVVPRGTSRMPAPRVTAATPNEAPNRFSGMFDEVEAPVVNDSWLSSLGTDAAKSFDAGMSNIMQGNAALIKMATKPFNALETKISSLYGIEDYEGAFDKIADVATESSGYWAKKAEEVSNEIKGTRKFGDIKNAGDFTEYVVNGVASQIPVLADIMLTTFAGGGLGKGAAKGIATQGAKAAAKKAAIKKVAKVLVGASPEAFAAASKLETGSIYGDMIEMGREEGDPEKYDNPVPAVIAGLVAGRLESIGFGKIYSRFKGNQSPAAKALRRNITRKLLNNKTFMSTLTGGANILDTMGTEGVTEFFQTYVEAAAVDSVNENRELFSTEFLKRNLPEALEAAAQGATVGGAFGGAGMVQSKVLDSMDRRRRDTAIAEYSARSQEAEALIPEAATEVGPGFDEETYADQEGNRIRAEIQNEFGVDPEEAIQEQEDELMSPPLDFSQQPAVDLTGLQTATPEETAAYEAEQAAQGIIPGIDIAVAQQAATDRDAGAVISPAIDTENAAVLDGLGKGTIEPEQLIPQFEAPPLVEPVATPESEMEAEKSSRPVAADAAAEAQAQLSTIIETPDMKMTEVNEAALAAGLTFEEVWPQYQNAYNKSSTAQRNEAKKIGVENPSLKLDTLQTQIKERQNEVADKRLADEAAAKEKSLKAKRKRTTKAEGTPETLRQRIMDEFGGVKQGPETPKQFFGMLRKGAAQAWDQVAQDLFEAGALPNGYSSTLEKALDDERIASRSKAQPSEDAFYENQRLAAEEAETSRQTANLEAIRADKDTQTVDEATLTEDSLVRKNGQWYQVADMPFGTTLEDGVDIEVTGGTKAAGVLFKGEHGYDTAKAAYDAQEKARAAAAAKPKPRSMVPAPRERKAKSPAEGKADRAQGKIDLEAFPAEINSLELVEGNLKVGKSWKPITEYGKRDVTYVELSDKETGETVLYRTKEDLSGFRRATDQASTAVEEKATEVETPAPKKARVPEPRKAEPRPDVLNDLNPSGGVFVDYSPEARATMPLAENMTTLDKTAGKAADALVTIFRGAPIKQTNINPGDYVTTSRQLAQDYAGNGHVIEAEVKMSDILDDYSEPLGEDYIYRPAPPAKPAPKKARVPAPRKKAEKTKHTEGGEYMARQTIAQDRATVAQRDKDQLTINKENGIRFELPSAAIKRVKGKTDEELREGISISLTVAAEVAPKEARPQDAAIRLLLAEQYKEAKKRGILEAELPEIETYLTEAPKPKARVPDPRKVEAKAAAEIKDFGEKIGGARKDYASVMTAAKKLDIASQPLSKVWPEPNYQKLLESGIDPWAVGFIRAARDEIPAKPRRSYLVPDYVKGVELLRSLAENVADGTYIKEKVQEMLDRPQFASLKDAVGSRAELYAEMGHEKSLKGIKLTKEHWTLYKGEENVTKWMVTRKGNKTAFSNMPQVLGEGNTKEEALDAFKQTYLLMNDAPKGDKKTKFTTYTYRSKDKPGVFIGKKIGKNYIDLYKFDTQKEASEFLKNNYDDISARLEAFKKIGQERRSKNSPRVGDDHRNGKDVTPEMFQESFGFRGVEFGNYVEQDRRQSDLDNAYDSLMDLAGILGIPSQAISLNGELGLAFGARGKGGKRAPAAHYEPGSVVINLTKKNGPGSLAHEWWHGVDYYFSKQAGKSAEAFTESLLVKLASRPGTQSGRNYQLPDTIREDIVQAFGTIVRTTKESGLPKRSKLLDTRRTKPYYSKTLEMTARAFENYVIERMAAQNQSNDYLANISDISEFAESMIESFFSEGSTAKDLYPYLTQDEVQPFTDAFDNFFATVKTKQTDKGVAMFMLEDNQVGTAAFKKWFGDSAVVDSKGDPMVVYHGTPKGDFNIFKDETHFTENKKYADHYQNPTASSSGVRKEKTAPKTFEAYLSIQKPFDTRIDANREIFEDQYYNQYGMGTPLSERGLPDWNDSRDLLEWIEETGQDFDGVIVDEGGTPEGGHRGFAWIPVSPTQIKSATDNKGTFDQSNPDIRFMLSDESSPYYSPLTVAITGLKQAKGTAAQMKAMLSKQPGVKAQEMEESGFNDWLDGKTELGEKVTKDEMQAFMEQNGVQITEITDKMRTSAAKGIPQYMLDKQQSPTLQGEANAKENIRRGTDARQPSGGRVDARRAGRERKLASIRGVYAGQSATEDERNAWKDAVVDEDTLATPEWQILDRKTDAIGYTLVPVKGVPRLSGMTDPVTKTILVNTESRYPAEQIHGHESFHILRLIGNALADYIQSNINTASDAFKTYKAALMEADPDHFNKVARRNTKTRPGMPVNAKAFGIALDQAIAEEMAANVFSGVRTHFGVNQRSAIKAGQEVKVDMAIEHINEGLSSEAMQAVGNTGPPAYMLVHHGTPHVWEPEKGFPHGRPRLDKMGTGEGFQTYGWGWYSAETSNVASYYAKELSGNKTGFIGADVIDAIAGIPFSEIPKNPLTWSFINAIQVGAAKTAKTNLSYEIKNLDKYAPEYFIDGEFIKDEDDLIKTETFLRSIKNLDTDVKWKGGTTYTLDIPDGIIPKLLDFDAPLSKQPKTVQDIVSGYSYYSPEMTGQEFYFALSKDLGSAQDASEELADEGIPGNKYLDQQSRSSDIVAAKTKRVFDKNNGDVDATIEELMRGYYGTDADKAERRQDLRERIGKGYTSNFVIWDQKVLDRIALLERNGEKLDAIREAQFMLEDQSATDEAYMAAVEAKDTDKLQAMVDQAAKGAGYNEGPLLHGTTKEFNTFQERKTPKKDEMFSFGFHFTDSQELSSRYGERQVSAHIKAENPLNTEQVVTKDSELGKWLVTIAPKTRWFPSEGQEVIYLRNALDAMPANRLKKALREAGYDSLHYNARFAEIDLRGSRTLAEGDTTIVLAPNQIKSAEAITRDDSGNVIPLSQRFNPKQEDIRFMLEDDPELKGKTKKQKVRVVSAFLEDVQKDIDAKKKKDEVERDFKAREDFARGRRMERPSELYKRVPQSRLLQNSVEAKRRMERLTGLVQIIEQNQAKIKALQVKGSTQERTKKARKKASIKAGQRVIQARKKEQVKGKTRLDKEKVKRVDLKSEAMQKIKALKQDVKKDRITLKEALQTFQSIQDSLPLEIRGKLKGVSAIPGKVKDETKSKYLLERIDQATKLLSDHDRRQSVKRIKKMLMPSKIATLKTESDEIKRDINDISKVVAMKADAYANAMAQFTEVDTIPDEQMDEFIKLATFGNLAEQPLDVVLHAENEISGLIKGQKLKYKIRLEDYLQRMYEWVDKARGEFSPEGRELSGTERSKVNKTRMALVNALTWDGTFEGKLDKAARFYKADEIYGSPVTRKIIDSFRMSDQAEAEALINNMETAWNGFDKIFGTKRSTRRKQALKNSKRVRNSGVFINMKSSITGEINRRSEKIAELGDKDTPATKRATRKILDQIKNLKKQEAVASEHEEMMMSKNEAYHMWQGWQDTEVRERMEKHGWTQTTIDQIETFAGPKVMEWAQWQMDEIYNNDDRFDDLDRKYRDVFFVGLGKVDNYSPRFYIYQKEGEQGKASIDMAEAHGQTGNYKSGRITVRVKHNRAPKPMDGDVVLMGYFAETEHFKAWGQAIKEARSILNNRDVQQIIDDFSGEKLRRSINGEINDAAAGYSTKAIKIGWMDKIRGNIAISKIALPGIAPSTKQLVSMPAFAGFIGVGPALWHTSYFMLHPKEAVKTAKKILANPLMKARGRDGYEQNMSEGLQPTVLGMKSLLKSITSGLILPTRINDKSAIVMGGLASYRHYRLKAESGEAGQEAKNNPEKYAMLRFLNDAHRAQQSARQMDLPDRNRMGSFANLFTTWKSSQSQYQRIINDATRNLVHHRGNTVQNLRLIAMFHLVLPVLFQAISNVMSGGDPWPDDEDDLIQGIPDSILRAAILGNANSWVILGDYVTAFTQGLIEGKAWGSTGTIPILEPSKSAGYVGAKLRGAVDDTRDMSWADWDRLLAKLMDAATGLPFERTVKQLKRIDLEPTQKTSRFQTPRKSSSRIPAPRNTNYRKPKTIPTRRMPKPRKSSVRRQ